LGSVCQPSRVVITEALRWQQVYPARPEAVPRLRVAVGGQAERAGASPDARIDISLAVSEAATNAVLHAYRGRAPGELVVEVASLPEGIQVVVTDDGIGLQPRPDSPGLGLGLPMLAQLTTKLDITVPDTGGTRVGMLFALERA